jgi:hypothetical protein
LWRKKENADTKPALRKAIQTPASTFRTPRAGYSLRVERQAAWRRGIRVRPQPIGVLWGIMATLVVLYAAHLGLGLGGRGTNDLFNEWINDGVLWLAAAACFAGALRATRSRKAWILVALALASWATGDTIWSARYGHAAAPPLTSISDVFWLAWYPLIVAALALLVTDRVPGFEFHRWVDGIAVMLVVATPWVALFLQPVAEHSGASPCDCVVNVSYPLGDAVLVGAALGVFALMGWRPGRMWLVLGAALAIMGIADALYSVHALGHSHHHAVYDAAGAGGATLVAYAAWQPRPSRLKRREPTGWSAIALPLVAQVLAIVVQIYALFHEIPSSERILTVAVLLIAMLQIVFTRPRRRSDERGGGEAARTSN